MRLTIFHKIFLDIFHIQIKYGDLLKIFHGILSVPENVVMDPNNVMGLNLSVNKICGIIDRDPSVAKSQPS